MKKLLISSCLLLLSCTDETNSKRVLQQMGFRDIKMTGHSFTACGEGDTVSDGFEARSPSGYMVSGAVCCGLIMKSCTIRLD